MTERRTVQIAHADELTEPTQQYSTQFGNVSASLALATRYDYKEKTSPWFTLNFHFESPSYTSSPPHSVDIRYTDNSTWSLFFKVKTAEEAIERTLRNSPERDRDPRIGDRNVIACILDLERQSRPYAENIQKMANERHFRLRGES